LQNDLHAREAARVDQEAALQESSARLEQALQALEAERTHSGNLQNDLHAREAARVDQEAALQESSARLEQALQALEAERTRSGNLQNDFAHHSAALAVATETLAAAQAEIATLTEVLEAQEAGFYELRVAEQADIALRDQRFEEMTRHMRVLSGERDRISDLLDLREIDLSNAAALINDLKADRDRFAAEAEENAAHLLQLTQKLEANAIAAEAERRDLLEAQQALAADQDRLTAELLDQQKAFSEREQSQRQAWAAERFALETDAETAQNGLILLEQLMAEERVALGSQLAAAEKMAVRELVDLTGTFESQRIEQDAQREVLLRDLRALSDERQMLSEQLAALIAEADRRKNDAGQEAKAIAEAVAAREVGWAQERAMYEDEVETIRALLREQLAGAETLRLGLAETKASVTALQAERDKLMRHARALEDMADQLLNSTSWKLTAPMRKLLEGVRRK
jgi:hypothetical protein